MGSTVVHRRAGGFAVLVMLFLPGVGLAQLVPVKTEDAILTAADPGYGKNLGHSVALSGDTILVGSPDDDPGGVLSGSAWVFVRTGPGWRRQAKLIAPDASVNDRLGIAVDIVDETAVIGAPGDADAGPNSGSVYVFVRHGAEWSMQAKLTAPDAAVADGFGRAVAISDDTVLVGSPGDDVGGSATGSAYVFARHGTSWSFQDKLTAAGATMGDNFGHSVALERSTAVVGSRRDNAPDNDSLARVFVRDEAEWSQQAELPTGPVAFLAPETSVSISGETVVVGSPQGYAPFAVAGAALVFVRHGVTWSLQAKLNASDFESGGQFGASVSIDGNELVVGAPLTDSAAVNAGSAYRFIRNGTHWIEREKLLSSDLAFQDHFGQSVALSASTLAVGAPNAGTDNPFEGAAYVFSSDKRGHPTEACARDRWPGTPGRDQGHVDQWLAKTWHWLCAIPEAVPEQGRNVRRVRARSTASRSTRADRSRLVR